MENSTVGKWNALHYSVKTHFHLNQATAVVAVQMIHVVLIIQQQMWLASRVFTRSIFIQKIKRCNNKCNQKIAQHAPHAR